MYQLFRFQKIAYENCHNEMQGNLGDYVQEAIIKNIIESVTDCKCSVVSTGGKYQKGKVVFPTLCVTLEDYTVNSFLKIARQVDFPLFFFYIHDDLLKQFPELERYLLKHQPIGCRSDITRNILRNHGIRAYQTGCPTIAFPERKNLPQDGGVPYIVDLSRSAINAIPGELQENAVFVSHSDNFSTFPPNNESFDRLYESAENRIIEYRQHASIIITSRLHAAAPAAAMGIPTVLMTDNADFRYSWVDKFIPVYQAQDYVSIDWCHAVQKPHIEEWAKKQIRELYLRYIHDRDYESIMEKLDEYYSKRNRTVYFKGFQGELKKLPSTELVRYLIWGAGVHCGYALDLIEQYNPQAEPVAIVDRFKTGERRGISIIKPDDFRKYSFDKIVITTNQGLSDATQMISEAFGQGYLSENCIMLHSQQIS